MGRGGEERRTELGWDDGGGGGELFNRHVIVEQNRQDNEHHDTDMYKCSFPSSSLRSYEHLSIKIFTHFP